MTANDTDEHVPPKERRDKDDQGEPSRRSDSPQPGLEKRRKQQKKGKRAGDADDLIPAGPSPARGDTPVEIVDSRPAPQGDAALVVAVPPSTGAEVGDTKGEENERTPVIHFDVDTGVMSYLLGRHDHVPSFECSCCGTVIEFETKRCPICGNILGKCDDGIVQLVADQDFDKNPDRSVDCPSCGEHVDLCNGRCPACLEVVGVHGAKDAAPKVDPVLRAENVVFLHLDVRSGEVSYLQKLPSRPWFEQASVQIPVGDTADSTKDSRGRTEA